MIQQRELNVRQVSRALNLPYQAIYQTIRFFSNGRIPTRKFRGRLLVPADALSLLQAIHNERRNRQIPRGWVRLAEFCRKYGLSPWKVSRWARRLGIARKFFPNCLCLHEDSTDKIRTLVAICKTGYPPKDEWVRLTDAVKSRKLRARVRSLLYLVQPLQVGKSVYLRRNELKMLLAEVKQYGRNYKIPVK